MFVKDIELTNFRNLKLNKYNFSNKINFIYGSNGSGKTNLIESIYYIGLGKSFKNNKDLNIINYEEDFFKIKTNIDNNGIDYQIECFYEKNKSKFISVNSIPIKKISNLFDYVQVVSFTPMDCNLLKGPPLNRRKFIDLFICKRENEYLTLINKYYNILNQRNILFKNEYIDEDLLNVLNKQFIDLCYEVYMFRKKYIKLIQDELNKYYSHFTLNKKIKIKYKSLLNEDEKKIYSKKINEKIRINYPVEVKKKTTLLGVHLEDFELTLDEKNIGEFNSQGENRIVVLCLKLVDVSLNKNKENLPILILDDVLSELDEDNIYKLLNLCESFEQVFITNAKYIEIENVNYIQVVKGV
ncbi:MAG: DNA replication/repair protein RecF [Bacillales bacterium]